MDNPFVRERVGRYEPESEGGDDTWRRQAMAQDEQPRGGGDDVQPQLDLHSPQPVPILREREHQAGECDRVEPENGAWMGALPIDPHELPDDQQIGGQSAGKDDPHLSLKFALEPLLGACNVETYTTN